ncbi:hypothetical protein Pla108_27880 [Botrimarina colliarenosi]|uniref:Uncharacterized protein n=1 Tax=Botrimarina colliarenosi TaxID=2528001 RepID=A0A5C6AD66_9BACT|nr:hypothetical protein [Botrimarina colliarenosi]TWT97011.1 hypothetical protein Pla108_27880 [Botrimarina colliarenosi]
MTDPYVSFDTFSVGETPAEPTPAPQQQRPSLLARLPRVAPSPPRPKPIQRFDDAESALHGVHLYDGGSDLAMAGPSVEPAPRRYKLSDPTATIRIDTVSPSTFDDETPEPPPRRQAIDSPTMFGEPKMLGEPRMFGEQAAIDDPWATWLLNLESTILPYSRIIVLAAVIAAMGLTFVLLRGGAAAMEAPNTSPQVSIDAHTDTLAAVEAVETVANPSAEEAPPFHWPVASTPTPASGALRPLDASPLGESVATTDSLPPSSFARGPASAWQGPAGAKLTGQVMPVDSGRVDVAHAPDYPQTTTR